MLAFSFAGTFRLLFKWCTDFIFCDLADICPHECYHRLKMALLLSLVGTGAEQEKKTSKYVLILTALVRTSMPRIRGPNELHSCYSTLFWQL